MSSELRLVQIVQEVLFLQQSIALVSGSKLGLSAIRLLRISLLVILVHCGVTVCRSNVGGLVQIGAAILRA